MAIFSVGKGPGNQLFDHAQGTMRQMLDRANALNVAPEGTPQGDAIKNIVAGQTAQGVMDKGGDGPRLEKMDGQLAAPREEKPTWEVDPQSSDITNTPGIPEYHDETKDMTEREKLYHAAALSGYLGVLSPATFGASAILGSALAAGSAVTGTLGTMIFDGAQVVSRPDPQRDRDIEAIPKVD